MAKKEYDWEGGAELKDHSKKKHKVLKEYIAEYMNVRCRLPQQSRFRLAVVDGFAGAGRYNNGEAGSPIILLETIRDAAIEIAIRRGVENMAPIEIDLLLVLNDADTGAIEQCRENLAPILAAIPDSAAQLNVETLILSQAFEEVYPQIKCEIASRGFKSNVIFNLDQYGVSQVSFDTLRDILSSHPSAEIFLTFAINTLVAYLPKHDIEMLRARLLPFGVDVSALTEPEAVLSRDEWLGAAERLVFQALLGVSPYTSPFSIHNPQGWRYWMVHFANNYRARQVYNDILHQNASSQAHYGRSGLRMLSYNPDHNEGALYLFGEEDRARAKAELYDDIPRTVANYGDALEVGEFYERIYNETPSHSDDIHSMMIENEDIQIITPGGGERRVPNTISRNDMILLKPQKSFFSLLFPGGKKS